MNDWKGNLIKVGDTVVTVATQSAFAGSDIRVGAIDMSGEYLSDPIHIEQDYLWIPTGEYKIIEGNVLTSYNDGFHHEFPLQFIDLIPTSCFLAPLIWCIKGVSDDKDDYYLNYFNK